MTVKVPEGCLLLQAGRTFEYITGGYIHAGFHEVTYTKATDEAKEKAIEEDRSTWRVSSTMFCHMRFNVDCSPLPELSHLHNKSNKEEYTKKMTAFDILMDELEATNMVAENAKY